MELKEIQSLIKFVSEASVDEVLLERKDFKLSIKKVPAPIYQAAPQIVQASLPNAPAPMTQPAQDAQASASAPIAATGLLLI